MRFRRAMVGDVADIVRIERDSFEHAGETFGARRVRYLIGSPTAIVMVADDGGHAVGWYAALVRTHGRRKSGRLYALAVHPDMQGRGLGKRLLSYALAALRRRGAKRIYLEVREKNVGAIGLYERYGFVRYEQLPDYYGLGLDGVRMVLETDHGH